MGTAFQSVEDLSLVRLVCVVVICSRPLLELGIA